MSSKKKILSYLTLLIILYSVTPYVVTRVAGNGVTEFTRTFPPTGDAHVSQGAPDENYNMEMLTVESYLNWNLRSFIKFDLSNIPPGSKVTSANLFLYMYDPPSSSRNLYCHRVETDWGETTITWNHQPLVTIDHYPYISTGTSANWLSWDVKYWVQKFAARDIGSYSVNYGFRVRDCNEDSTAYYILRFRSREASSNKPYLKVSYYPPHLELEPSSSSLEAGKWVMISVWRATEDGDYVTRGNLKVKFSSTSTSANKKFSLTEGGAAITELTIPDGSKKADFWYYDDRAGTWDIHVWTEDYMYIVTSGYFFIPVMNYGDDTGPLEVTPGPLDRFAFDTISSPKQVAVSFPITITASDSFGNTVTSYTGTNSLSDTTGTINPVMTGAFVNGKWTGNVVINAIWNGVKISTSGSGKTGQSNAFNVIAGPAEKLLVTPSTFTMAAGVTYSYLEISLRDANNFETTKSADTTVGLSTTSTDGEFRQFGTDTRITSIAIPAGQSSVKVDYYDIMGGTQTLTASATGLTSGTATATVIPDTIPPVTTMTTGTPKYQGGATLYVSGSTGFTISATDDASGVKETKYMVDGGSWNTYISEFTLSTLSDGSHTIGYCSSDRAGNNEAEKTLTIMLDKTHPALSGGSPTGSLILSSMSVRFTIGVEDVGSGVKEVRLTVDGSSQGTMSIGSDYTKTLTISEGSHTWGVEAVDNVDNVASWSGTFTLTVDTAPPSVSDLSAPSNPVFGEYAPISCQVSDAISGVMRVNLYYSTNGGSSWTNVTMALQGGMYMGSIPSQMPFTEVQYYVEAVDNVGNAYRTTAARYSIGIPMWLYATIIAVVALLIVALLLRRRKPAPQPVYPPPPPPPP